MKTNSLTLLGIAFVVFNTSKAATTEITEKANAETTLTVEQGDAYLAENVSFDKRKSAPVEETIENPYYILGSAYQKSSEDVIAEDNKIIESDIKNEGIVFFKEEKSIETIILENNQIIEGGNTTEIHPLYLETTIEDRINEDNAIIESNISAAAMPLNIEVSNKKAFTLKQTLTL